MKDIVSFINKPKLKKIIKLKLGDHVMFIITTTYMFEIQLVDKKIC
jgi:hypothetical protein